MQFVSIISLAGIGFAANVDRFETVREGGARSVALSLGDNRLIPRDTTTARRAQLTMPYGSIRIIIVLCQYRLYCLSATTNDRGKMLSENAAVWKFEEVISQVFLIIKSSHGTAVVVVLP
jgi:hypothetical protein